MTTTKILASYKNNDYKVFLLNDGTKIRRGNSFNAEFPESIDLKITNYCDLGCPFCHEHSTRRGKHGDEKTILDRLYGLPRGIELALGGGNPLDFPNLKSLLSNLSSMGFIVNMTINSKHLAMEKYQSIANDIFPMIYGLGISGQTENPYESSDKSVNHFIIGEQSIDDLLSLSGRYKKVLLLGYKTYGRGEKYGIKNNDRIQKNINGLTKYIKSVCDGSSKDFDIISFDNLAIRQLSLKEYMRDFDSFFMGEDGKFTMYYDGVSDMYAKSSTSVRQQFPSDCGIKDVFGKYI